VTAGLWYRLTYRAATVVWWLPMPERVRVLLSQIVYRNPPMSAERAAEALAALERAGVRAAVMGGWGVDALGGRQSRRHQDLDLLVDPGEFERAIDLLERLGFREWHGSSDNFALGSMRIQRTKTLRDPAMRVVDVHGTDLDDEGLELATGTIAGREVLCISPRQQLDAQTGRAWTWGRRHRRRAMLAAMTVLIAAGAAPEIGGGVAASAAEDGKRPGLARPAGDDASDETPRPD
jgi:lincosamide nucleotidyltransferase A/C/D/E